MPKCFGSNMTLQMFSECGCATRSEKVNVANTKDWRIQVKFTWVFTVLFVQLSCSLELFQNKSPGRKGGGFFNGIPRSHFQIF